MFYEGILYTKGEKMSNGINIRKMEDNDWDEVKKIYWQGIETGNGTFEKETPEWEKWDRVHHKNCRLIAEIDNKIVGFAVLQPVSQRSCYYGVAEVSVYVEENSRGKGIGEKVLSALVDDSEKEGYWTLQSSIFSDNLPSRKIHEKCGFRLVGYREKQAKDFSGRWRDTVTVERRSKIVGND